MRRAQAEQRRRDAHVLARRLPSDTPAHMLLRSLHHTTRGVPAATSSSIPHSLAPRRMRNRPLSPQCLPQLLTTIQNGTPPSDPHPMIWSGEEMVSQHHHPSWPCKTATATNGCRRVSELNSITTTKQVTPLRHDPPSAPPLSLECTPHSCSS